MAAQDIIALVERLHPLAQLTASLKAQRRAVRERGDALTVAWGLNPSVRDAYPDGWWETDIDSACFCAEGPSGHASGTVGCLFGDGQQLGWMCPDCRKPARVRVNYGSSPHIEYRGTQERFCDVETTCCHATPCLPNGQAWDQVSGITVEDMDYVD